MKIGRVYKIICAVSDVVYVGSTFDQLKYRWVSHKAYYKRYQKGQASGKLSIFEHFDEHGLEKFKIVLIKEYPSCDRKHLRVYEQLWINKLTCCNDTKAFQPLWKARDAINSREYYAKNKERINESNRHNHHRNKTERNLRRREYYREHREESLQRQKERSQNNKEERAEWYKEYYQKHRVAIIERVKPMRRKLDSAPKHGTKVINIMSYANAVLRLRDVGYQDTRKQRCI